MLGLSGHPGNYHSPHLYSYYYIYPHCALLSCVVHFLWDVTCLLTQCSSKSYLMCEKQALFFTGRDIGIIMASTQTTSTLLRPWPRWEREREEAQVFIIRITQRYPKSHVYNDNVACCKVMRLTLCTSYLLLHFSAKISMTWSGSPEGLSQSKFLPVTKMLCGFPRFFNSV